VTSFGNPWIDGTVRAVIKRSLRQLRRAGKPGAEAQRLATALEALKGDDASSKTLIAWARQTDKRRITA
jgi:hypothetical protein